MYGILVLLGVILFLVAAVSVFKIHPVIVLLFAGLALGLLMGGNVESVTESLLSGFGNTLKWIGLVIFFGTVLGEILAATGGAELIAKEVINVFGEKYLPLGVAVIGFLVGIPVFMDVAYLTLLPTIIVLSRKTKHSVLVLGLSLAISLTVSHALIPPTPGPLAVAAMLEMDISSIIPANIFTALFATAGGLVWILFRAKKWNAMKSVEISQKESSPVNTIKGLYKVLPFVAILSPLVLMSLGTFYKGDNELISFMKNPIWALIIGVCFALPLINKEKFTEQLNKFFQDAGSKSALVILITGAGGAFGKVIKDSGVIDSIVAQSGELASFGIMIPYLSGLSFTSITGSITVSLLTSSSIVAPLVNLGSMPGEVAAAAICAGALAVIHVNSSFFWLFKELHKFTVSQVLRSLGLLSLVTSLSGLLGVFIYQLLFA